MIVYAFYGLGKTTFVEEHSDICVDLDEEYYHFRGNFPDGYAKAIYKYHNEGKIVFINANENIIKDEDISIAFLPSTICVSLLRLRNRGVDNDFISNLYQQRDSIYESFKKRFSSTTIYIEDDTYISNYEDLILSQWRKEREL